MSGPRFRFVTRTACPACGGEQGISRYRRRFDHPPISTFIAGYYGIDPALLASGEYRVDQCRSCETFFQAEVGDPGLLATLYGQWLFDADQPEGDPRYAYDMAHPRRSRDGHEIMAACAFLHVPPGKMETLDYGMGRAGWARVAAALGCRSYGTDIAEGRRFFAARNGVRTICHEEIEGRRFHFINTEQVMEHLADPADVVRGLAEALHPGGILKISVPSQRGVEALLGRLAAEPPSVAHKKIMPVLPLEHVNCFSREGLVRLGHRFGLKPVRPSLTRRYSFLLQRGSMDFADPRRVAKELARPFYQWANPKNIYTWLRREA